MLIVYAVFEQNKIVYIGQTIHTLADRIKGHKETALYSKNKYPLAQAIHDKGIHNFKFVVIDKAQNIKELNAKEQYYINKYNTQNEGYNVYKGGGNRPHTEKTKEKISKAHRGKQNHMYGIKGKDNPTSIGVINLITGDTYHSVTECSKHEGQSISKIAEVCRGDKAGVNGRVYRYLDDSGNIIHIPNEKEPKTKPVFNKTTNEWYWSYSEASTKLGYHPSFLSKRITREKPDKNMIIIDNNVLIYL